MPVKTINWPDPRIVVNVAGYNSHPSGLDIPPKITPTGDKNLTVGQPFNFTFTTTQGTPPISWFSTALPTGLFLSINGTLTGTPSVAGDYPITVEARGPSNVGSDYISIVLHIAPADAIFFGNFPGPIPVTFTSAQISALTFTRISPSRYGQYEFPPNSGEYQIIAWPSSYSIAGAVNLRLGNGQPLVTQPINNAPYQTNLTINGKAYSVFVSAWTHAGGLLIASNTQLVVE